jgi:hypothetical protein
MFCTGQVTGTCVSPAVGFCQVGAVPIQLIFSVWCISVPQLSGINLKICSPLVVVERVYFSVFIFTVASLTKLLLDGLCKNISTESLPSTANRLIVISFGFVVTAAQSGLQPNVIFANDKSAPAAACCVSTTHAYIPSPEV